MVGDGARLLARLAGDEAPATSEARAVVDGVPADLVSATRLNYRVERRGSRWGIVALDAIYERDSLTAARPGAAVAVPAAELAAFRPSYPLLAWYLSRAGYGIGPDLPGDDQPAARDEFYRQTWAWLAG